MSEIADKYNSYKFTSKGWSISFGSWRVKAETLHVFNFGYDYLWTKTQKE